MSLPTSASSATAQEAGEGPHRQAAADHPVSGADPKGMPQGEIDDRDDNRGAGRGDAHDAGGGAGGGDAHDAGGGAGGGDAHEDGGVAAVVANDRGGHGDERPSVAVPPRTGDVAVDEALQKLTGLLNQPLEAQVDGYTAVHGRLQDRLADLDG